MINVSQIVGELLLGWLAADLMSGAFHFWQDRLLPADTPFLGRWLVEPSLLHHSDPLAFTAGDFMDRNLACIVFALVVGGLLTVIFGASLLIASMTLGGCIAAQVHYWAHRPSEAPKLVRVMQQVGVFQSPKHHAGHHRPPQTARYCVLTDWLNPIIDCLRRGTHVYA